ncbi:MAG: carbohydrate kinase [Bacillota bacterium]|nr:carbohydrate kinase [Bacillota bacterium]
MNSILCIGELLIDFIGAETGKPIAKQSSFLMKAGGAPGNVACTIGALGGKCYLSGAVGKDGFGDFLIETLKSFNVSIDAVKRSEEHTTLAFVSVDQNGERDFVFNRGADADLDRTDIDNGIFEECPIIHLGAATGFLEGSLKKTYIKVLSESYEKNRFISFDPNYRSAFWANDTENFIETAKLFIEKSDLVKLSEEEALLISEKGSLNEAVIFFKEQYSAVFAITLGSEGVRLFNRAWDEKISAPVVKVKDTTGAGDAFIGALIYEIGKSEAPKMAVKEKLIMMEYAEKSNRVASVICTEYGALTALDKI